MQLTDAVTATGFKRVCERRVGLSTAVPPGMPGMLRCR